MLITLKEKNQKGIWKKQRITFSNEIMQQQQMKFIRIEK